MRLYLNSDKAYRRKGGQADEDPHHHRNMSQVMYLSGATIPRDPNLRSDNRSSMKSAKGRTCRPTTTFVQVSYGSGGMRNGPMRPQTANPNAMPPNLHTKDRARPVRTGMSEALLKNDLDYNASFMRKVEHPSRFYSDFGNIRAWRPSCEPSIMTGIWDAPLSGGSHSNAKSVDNLKVFSVHSRIVSEGEQLASVDRLFKPDAPTNLSPEKECSCNKGKNVHNWPDEKVWGRV